MRATPTITSLGGFVRYGPGGQQTPSNVAHTITRWSTQLHKLLVVVWERTIQCLTHFTLEQRQT